MDIEEILSALSAAASIEEQWNLAQSAYARLRPAAYAKIQNLRKEILGMARDQIADPRKVLCGGGFQKAVRIRTAPKAIRSWKDIIFTPEVDGDPIFDGVVIPRRELMVLKTMILKQNAEIKRALRGLRKEKG